MSRTSEELPLLSPHVLLHPSESQHQEGETSTDETPTDDIDGDGNLRLDSGEPEKKASPWWLVTILPFFAFAIWATVAPRIEVYIILACKVLRPEYTSSVDYPFAGHHDGTLAFRKFPFVNSLHLRNEPSPKRCASDPVVQAEVAKLVALLSVSSGIISCITTGWWGSFSDRHGRKFVMGISVIGLILSNFNIIFVSWFASRLPGNYRFLLVGSIIEGALGGPAVAGAAVEAYIADCTDSSSRTRMFSIAMGLMSAGRAFGPTLGGLLISTSHQVLSVFYLAVVLFLFCIVLAWTVLPESLSQKQMLVNKSRYAVQQREGSGWDRAFRFLSPLSIFLPVKVQSAHGTNDQQRTDWNLTLIAVAYASTVMVLDAHNYLFQYASYAFGWTTETIGYWLGLVGMTKAVFLSLILPAMIKWLKSKSPVMRISESLNPLNQDGLSPSPPSSLEQARSITFDLSLACLSLVVEMISYAFMALVSSPYMFTAFAVFGELGTGFAPAVESVALEVYTWREHQIRSRGVGRSLPVEIGKLYGGLGVVQALFSQVLGPAMFALIYMSTVASVPSAVFLFPLATVILSFVLLTLVFPKPRLHV